METGEREEDRLQNLVKEVETRVESLRQQASSLKREKESILELLQDFQDGPTRNVLSEDTLEDFEYNIERLVLRCLTVEVSVSTPRNETQEDAFAKASAIVDDLKKKMTVNPISHLNVLESHLNACLTEPVSSKINLKFQEKLLGCTVEDQKYFRKQLETMYTKSGKGNGSLTNGFRLEVSDNDTCDRALEDTSVDAKYGDSKFDKAYNAPEESTDHTADDTSLESRSILSGDTS